MKSKIRVLKRCNREQAIGSEAVDGSKVVERMTPEMIVKNWISASRQRRRVEAEEHQRSFKQWEENLVVLWEVGSSSLAS